jgi:hypothetical protein
MHFPTTQFMSVEEFGVVAAVSRFALNKYRFVDFLSNPSLIRVDFYSAVDKGLCDAVYLTHRQALRRDENSEILEAFGQHDQLSHCSLTTRIWHSLCISSR